jgi:hypothetical protein
MISLELKTKVLQAHSHGDACSIGLFITAIENGVCVNERLLDTRFTMGTLASEILSYPDLEVPSEFTEEWMKDLSGQLEELSMQIGFDHKEKRIR